MTPENRVESIFKDDPRKSSRPLREYDNDMSNAADVTIAMGMR